MADVAENLRDELTVDAVLGGAVRLAQPREGYRAGLDAALLAAACKVEPGERALEAGCGVGAALLAAAVRNPGADFVGLERDPKMRALAQANIAINDLAERVAVIECDIAEPFRHLGLERFDAVMANPPFFDDPKVLRGPLPARRGAYIADDGLGAWIEFMMKAVRERGRITLIHRADRLADILALLSRKCGSFRVLPVQPFEDAPAKRVLVRAIKSGRAPLVIRPALVLHDRGAGKHRPHIESILRGQAGVAWA
ncbi:MAG TPA: methyltransferase domain-containing protein [Caulobacteraceae bacterium]|nr:methyltransferase domain-containing protein [Caulobacteraceae bacterium]